MYNLPMVTELRSDTAGAWTEVVCHESILLTLMLHLAQDDNGVGGDGTSGPGGAHDSDDDNPISLAPC